MTDDTPSAIAHAAVRRLSGLPPERVRVVVDGIGDGFRVRAAGQVLHVRASGAGAAVAGYAAWVRRTGVAHVSRFGTRPVDRDLPDDVLVEGRAGLDLRVAHNLTVGGYTTPWFGWASWEAEIDLLAAAGVNAAHVTLGQELVYLATFTRFGYSEEEILRWLGPPSHQPWLWLNNIEFFGRGTSRALVDARADLARRVLRRMRELDIVAILPGFSGTVPPGLDEHVPGARTVPQGRWFMDVVGPRRPDWLDTTTEAYAELARVYYAEQRAAFGAPGMWAVDLLHEGGRTGGTDLGAAARGVQRAMTAADPVATWVLQAWIGNPRAELLDAIDLRRVHVLDLTGEAADPGEGFRGAPWSLGILPNYGGRTVLYGDLEAVAALPGRWTDGTRTPGLTGLTNMAEGVANNPVLWDLFADLTWADGRIDVDTWLDRWVAARYGRRDEHARAAWRILARTAYGAWRHAGTGVPSPESTQAMSGLPVDAGDVRGVPELAAQLDPAAVPPELAPYASTDSVIAAVPSLRANQAGPVGPRALGHPENALVPALRELLAAAGTLDTPGLRHDVADLARQVADDAARAGVRAIARAADAGELRAFDEAVDRFLGLIDAQEDVLAANEHFLLGRWTADAEAWGATPEESAELAGAAKRLLTSWGYEDATFLHEYANRAWAGLVGGYHRSRWSAWLAEVRHVLCGEATTPIDWYRWADEWVRAGTRYPDRPHGDLRAAAATVLEIADRLVAGQD